MSFSSELTHFHHKCDYAYSDKIKCHHIETVNRKNKTRSKLMINIRQAP